MQRPPWAISGITERFHSQREHYLRVVVSAANLSHWWALICCNLVSLSVALSAANFSVCAKGIHLSQSGIFISSSFTAAKHSCWRFSSLPLAVWVECLLLSLSSAFWHFLLLLVYFCQRRSFPPFIGSLGQPWNRISPAFCNQACLHNC